MKRHLFTSNNYWRVSYVLFCFNMAKKNYRVSIHPGGESIEVFYIVPPSFYDPKQILEVNKENCKL